MAKFKVIDKGIVDDKQWYSVLCEHSVTKWLYGRPSAYHFVCVTSSGHIFDIPESTYLVMIIFFGGD